MFNRFFKSKQQTSQPQQENPLKRFEVDHENLLLEDEMIPLTYWVLNPNFGDLLSPWLVTKLTGIETKLVRVGTEPNKKLLKKPTYISTGSILSRAQDTSIVWGSGSFGTEQSGQISNNAKYHAVRGPLTRCLVQNNGVSCPAIYGDPALLSPLVYNPEVKVEHEVGVVLRWSEKEWLNVKPGKGVKLIDLGTGDIERVIREMKSCKAIITSSLHGLIIADTYGIPNAWLSSKTPKGGEFKFFDYFLSVDKVRYGQTYDVKRLGLEVSVLHEHFDFDGRPIKFDAVALLRACPFLKEVK